MALLFLLFLSALALHFSLFLQRQQKLAMGWRQEDLLRDGEAAALAHVLALCDENLDGEGLTNRLFQSGYELDGERTEYAFVIRDQMEAGTNYFSAFPPLTAPRFGKEDNYGERPTPWDEEGLAAYASSLLKTAGGFEEEGKEYAQALLDRLDVNHGRGPFNSGGEGLELTGMETGDQRLAPFDQGILLSGFFSTNMVRGGVYQCFTVKEREYFYDPSCAGTNTRIRLSEYPAGGLMKRHWKTFLPYLGMASSRGWPRDFFKGEAVFVSSCGGQSRRARVLSNGEKDIVLKGLQDIPIGDYFLHEGGNFEKWPGLFCLKSGTRDFFLATGLWAGAEYRLRYRGGEGLGNGVQGEPNLRFFWATTSLTGGWRRISSDREGRLFLGLQNSSGHDLGALGLELVQPERLHVRNAGSHVLHLEGLCWRLVTGEGLERKALLSWSRPPVLSPGEKFEVVRDINPEFHGGAIRGYASLTDLTVPYAVDSAKIVRLDRGFGIRLRTKSAPFKRRSPPSGTLVYLRRKDTSGTFLGFPVSDTSGERELTLFMGARETAEEWLPGALESVYLPCFHCDINQERVFLDDHFGQELSLIFGREDWLVPRGFHNVREKGPREEILKSLNCVLATGISDLEIVSPVYGLEFARGNVRQRSDLSVSMENLGSAGENFWRGFNLYLEDGSLYRVRGSFEDTLFLDRNPGLKGSLSGCLSPGDEAVFLAGPNLEAQTWTLALPPSALLPGTLYLAGHGPLPDHRPAYTVSLFNFALKEWEPRAEGRTFPANDVMNLGRLTSDYRDPRGCLKLRIEGRNGGPRGYWMQKFFLVSDTQVRESGEERCDSYTVSFKVDVRDREGEKAFREGVWLIQRRWEKGGARPLSFLAGKVHCGH